MDEETRTGWPSIPKLAQKAKLDDRNVQRAIQRLVRINELRVIPRAFQSNLYCIPELTGGSSATPGETPPPAQRHPSGGDTYTPPGGASATQNRHSESSVNHPERRRSPGWHTVPEDEKLTEDRTRMAREAGLSKAVAEREWAKFVDHEFADAKRDVDKTWRNWCRRAPEFAGGARAAPASNGHREWTRAVPNAEKTREWLAGIGRPMP